MNRPPLALSFAIISMAACAGFLTARADGLHDPAEYLSGTLPVLYVNTQDSTPVTSKDYYLDGTYYLDAAGFEDRFESIGSADNQLPLQIKGRGNTTWRRFDKKPYRVKLGKKAGLMGLTKSKHFCLMSHPTAAIFCDDRMGFALSDRLGLAWAPRMEPVEMVLNGDYVGLYWVCEKIHVAKDRVAITEQADGEEDPAAITGGWLMDLDNTPDASQFDLTDRSDGTTMHFTWHSPDSLSDAQFNYIRDFISTADSLIYVADKNDTTWQRYIDIDALVRFYVVNEMMDNAESFTGSCFFHKDRGDSAKIIFGPVWDMGSAFSHWKIAFTDFIYCQTPSYAHQHWIGELARFNSFQRKVRQVWREVKANGWDNLDDVIDRTLDEVEQAAASDKRRWPDYGFSTVEKRKRAFKNCLKLKCEWLDGIWGREFTFYGDLNCDGRLDIEDVNALINIMLEKTAPDRMADINFDGATDVEDLNLMLNRMLDRRGLPKSRE